MQVLQWIETHQLTVWLIVSSVILPILRLKTPEQWVALAETSPRLHGLMKAMRAAGFDPVGVVKGLITFLTGKALPSGTELPRPPSVPPGAGTALVLFLCLGMATQAAGCATWADTARHSLEATATAVNGVDRSVASAVRVQCASAAQGPVGADRDAAVDACLAAHHLDTARRAIQESDRALRVAQATLDGAEKADDEGRWTAAVPCLAVALRGLGDALLDAGVPIPDPLAMLINNLPVTGCGG